MLSAWFQFLFFSSLPLGFSKFLRTLPTSCPRVLWALSILGSLSASVVESGYICSSKLFFVRAVPLLVQVILRPRSRWLGPWLDILAGPWFAQVGGGDDPRLGL